MIVVPAPALYAGALVLALAGSLLLTPIAARLARRLDVVDRPTEQRYHTIETPYLGGMAVAIGTVLAAGAASGASMQLLVILLGGLALSIIGLMDDQRIVHWTVKLVAEIAAGYALWLVGVRAGLFGSEVLDLALTLFWVVGVTNAVNMLDNMDGLASGVSGISALTFFGIAAGRGDYLVGAFAFAVAGAAFGFLRWNFPPARIFLGDAGSLLLGFFLAALGLKLDLVGESGLVRTVIPILALAAPIFDATLVIVARARDRRPVYQGGIDHTSHRLAALGLSGRRIAVLSYVGQAVCGGLAILLLGASDDVVGVAAIAITAVALTGVTILLRLPRRPREPADVRLHPAEAPAPR